MAKASINLLFNHIEGEIDSAGAQQRIFDAELVVGESTARCAG